jgi:hypothetical protein
MDIEPMLIQLESAGFVIRYRVDGRALMWIPNFLDHQQPHKNETSSHLPEYVPNTSDGSPMVDQGQTKGSTCRPVSVLISVPVPVPVKSVAPVYSSLPSCLMDERIKLNIPGKPTLPAAVLGAYERAFGIPAATDLAEFSTAIHDGCLHGCPKTPEQAAWCAEHLVWKLDHKAGKTWKTSRVLRLALLNDREDHS